MLAFIEKYFGEEARMWWRLWSNRLAIIVAAAATWMVDNPDTVLQWVSTIDQPWRSVLTFTVVAVVPILVRSARQPSLAPPNTGGVA